MTIPNSRAWNVCRSLPPFNGVKGGGHFCRFRNLRPIKPFGETFSSCRRVNSIKFSENWLIDRKRKAGKSHRCATIFRSGWNRLWWKCDEIQWHWTAGTIKTAPLKWREVWFICNPRLRWTKRDLRSFHRDRNPESKLKLKVMWWRGGKLFSGNSAEIK